MKEYISFIASLLFSDKVPELTAELCMEFISNLGDDVIINEDLSSLPNDRNNLETTKE